MWIGAAIGNLLVFVDGAWVEVANIVKVRGNQCEVECEREGKNGFCF